MSRNQSLALALLAITAVVCGAVAIAVISWPEEALKRYDTAWLRAILLLVASLLSALLAVELYGLWHDPTALRMTRQSIRYVKAVGTVGSLGPMGLFGLQKFDGWGVAITLQEAGFTSGFIFLVAVIGVILLNQHYTNLEQAKH
jgi:drug/metabolite transporter (DMT)-like permease